MLSYGKLAFLIDDDCRRHGVDLLIHDCALGDKGDAELMEAARNIVDRNAACDLAVLVGALMVRIKDDAREKLRLQCPYGACARNADRGGTS